MALAFRLSTLESWTGPLACDDVLRARFPDVYKQRNPVIAAYLETGDASHLGDLTGVCMLTVRPPDPDVNLMTHAEATDKHPFDGMSRRITSVKAFARACLVGISDLPDLVRNAGGFPIDGLKVLSDVAYAAVLAEVATHASRLGSLGKSHPPSCNGRSVPLSPGATVGASLSATDVTGAAP